MTTQTLRNPCTLPTNAPKTSLQGQAVVRKPSMLVWLLDLLVGWNERARMRNRLHAMPDHLLRDMGLSRADVAYEVEKPFWRA